MHVLLMYVYAVATPLAVGQSRSGQTMTLHHTMATATVRPAVGKDPASCDNRQTAHLPKVSVTAARAVLSML